MDKLFFLIFKHKKKELFSNKYLFSIIYFKEKVNLNILFNFYYKERKSINKGKLPKFLKNKNLNK